MDPFSITLGVITLTSLASTAGIELKRLRSSAAEATNNVNAMLADLKALKTVLDLIEDGFEDLDSRAPLTGHIGAHWSALKTTLGDACESMQKLESLLVSVNKDVKYLDSTRRAIRLREANDQIVMYRQEIQAYKDTLQLSFQSVIFFQQCTVSQNTAEILDRSHDLHQDLGRLAANLEVKLTALEMILADRQSTDNASINHLQRCARTAATVVASASTVLGDDAVDESAETSDVMSEFGWLSNDAVPSTLTLNWISSLRDGQASSSDTLQRSPDLSTSAADSASASRHTSMPSSPLNLSSTHGHTRQTSTGSITLASPPMSSPELSQSIEFEPQQSWLGDDETAKITSTRKRRHFSLSKLLSPRNKSKTTSRKKEPLLPLSPLCKDDLSVSAAGEVMVKWTFVGDGACGKTCFLM